jgi:hypothetical protein
MHALCNDTYHITVSFNTVNTRKHRRARQQMTALPPRNSVLSEQTLIMEETGT